MPIRYGRQCEDSHSVDCGVETLRSPAGNSSGPGLSDGKRRKLKMRPAIETAERRVSPVVDRQTQMEPVETVEDITDVADGEYTVVDGWVE